MSASVQQLAFPFPALPAIVGKVDRKLSIDEQFKQFHEANPAVYDALRNLALDMRRRGVQHYGTKGLFEVLRWSYSLQTQGDEFLLNNNYTSRYARLLMQQEPELAGFFETRELKSATSPSVSTASTEWTAS